MFARDEKRISKNVYVEERVENKIFNISKILQCKSTKDVFCSKQGAFGND